MQASRNYLLLKRHKWSWFCRHDDKGYVTISNRKPSWLDCCSLQQLISLDSEQTSLTRLRENAGHPVQLYILSGKSEFIGFYVGNLQAVSVSLSKLSWVWITRKNRTEIAAAQHQMTDEFKLGDSILISILFSLFVAHLWYTNSPVRDAASDVS